MIDKALINISDDLYRMSLYDLTKANLSANF